MRTLPRTCCSITALALLSSPGSAPAAITNIAADGHITASTQLTDCFTSTCNPQRCGNPPASAVFSLSPGPADASVNLPECTLTSPDDAAISASAKLLVEAQMADDIVGNQHTFSVGLFGTASAHSTFPATTSHGASAFAHAIANGAFRFRITDHDETVTITPQFTGRGMRFGFAVVLSTPTADFTFGHDAVNDVDLPDTLPRVATLSPGTYTVTWSIQGAAFEDQGNPLTFPEARLNMTLTVVAGQANRDVHWANPDGGDFAVAANWNPQQVPVLNAEHSDTAIFDLNGSPSPIPIATHGNQVGKLAIRHMGVDLNGPLLVLGTDPSNFNFALSDGGTLVLDNGVLFSTMDGGIGTRSGAEASVFVSGTGTKWTSGTLDAVQIGDAGPGKLVVDHDATLDAQQAINIGGAAAGTLRLESGGSVQTPAITLHRGSIQVRGIGVSASKIEIAGALEVAPADAASGLIVEAGGNLTAHTVTLSAGTQQQGSTLTIAGTDTAGLPSAMFVSGPNGELHVAGETTTVAEVKDNALLSITGLARIGEGAKTGKVLVHGRGPIASGWTILGNAIIGSQHDDSELEVREAGKVDCSQELTLGLGAGEQGRAIVNGTDSLLSADKLIVGSDGQGQLFIQDGARVESATGIVGRSQQVNATTPPGSTVGSGSGSVTIQGDPVSGASEWHVTGDCLVATDELGTILLQGFSIGPFSFGGATLRVDGNLVIGQRGTIHGSGTLAVGHVANHGVISPGLSPGVITIEGDYEQASDGVLQIEMAGAGEGQFDILKVTGNATLDGKVEMHFLDGFLPKQGDSIDFLQVTGSVTGSFTQVSFPELAEGFDADLALTSDGKLRLTARADASTGGGTTLTPPEDLTAAALTPAVTSPACGAGTCGAGATLMAGVALVGFVSLKRSCRRAQP